MNKCKTCKWWVGNQVESDHFRSCESPKALIGYHHKVSDLQKDGVMVEDDEGWGWYMGPDFGCVNHEDK